MKRSWALFTAMLLTLMMCLGLSGCGKDLANHVNSVDDLKGSKIGVQLGTTGDIYVSDYEGDKEGTKVERYRSGADAVQALKQGKIDAVVIDEQPAKKFVEQNENLRILDEEFTNEDYAACVAKGNDELLEKVNEAIADIKADGTLDKILDSYINGNSDYHYEQKVTDGEKLIMATNAQFPPYEYYKDGDNKGAIVGIDVEIGHAIADKLGLVLEIEDMEFDSIINAVSSGKADIGLAGFTVTPEREKEINFSDPYTTSKQVIIVRDNAKKKVVKNKVHSVDDLEGSKIGVQLGTTGDIYVSDYEGDDKGTKVERYRSGTDAVQALKQGKIDAVVIDEQPAKAFVNQNKGLMILDEEFTNEDYAAVIAKGNDELLANVNEAISDIKADGTLDKILDSYINGNGDYHYVQKVTDGDKLVMATNAQFPPYEYYKDGADKDSITGIDVEIGHAIADKLGLVLEIEDMEFDSIINAVSSGKADIGLAGFTVTPEREKEINFSDSYTTSKQVIIVRDDSQTSVGSTLKDQFRTAFVQDSRYKFLLRGLGNTIIIAFFAALLGIFGGFLLAVIRVAHDKNGYVPVLNFLAKIYIAVIRGTPVMVQLLIIYYIIFASVDINKVIVAIVAFGINSSAYVAEIVRSGIMSIDEGQFEAGKSLGLKFSTVMLSVILPQAFKNILPALANEFISLLKETSISGYIGLTDLTRGGDIIRSVTYQAFLPLIAVAVIYLVIVIGLSALVSRMERSLKKNER